MSAAMQSGSGNPASADTQPAPNPNQPAKVTTIPTQDQLSNFFNASGFTTEQKQKMEQNPSDALALYQAAQDNKTDVIAAIDKRNGLDLSEGQLDSLRSNAVALAPSDSQSAQSEPPQNDTSCSTPDCTKAPNTFQPGSSNDSKTDMPTGPLQYQSANDQIRTTSAALCAKYELSTEVDSVTGVSQCTQFQNNMIATFYYECGGQASCSCARGYSTFCGSYQLSSEMYENGIKNFTTSCDPTNSSCQYAQTSCEPTLTTTVDPRFDHLCNSAAAAGNHVQIEQAIQAAAPADPQTQAAIHATSQLIPGPITKAANSDDPDAIFSTTVGGKTLDRSLSNNDLCFQMEPTFGVAYTVSCANRKTNTDLVRTDNSITLGNVYDGLKDRSKSLNEGVAVANGYPGANPGLGSLPPSVSQIYNGKGNPALFVRGWSTFSFMGPF